MTTSHMSPIRLQLVVCRDGALIWVAMVTVVNCGSTYNVTTSGDCLYEDGLILIVQFSSHEY